MTQAQFRGVCGPHAKAPSCSAGFDQHARPFWVEAQVRTGPYSKRATVTLTTTAVFHIRKRRPAMAEFCPSSPLLATFLSSCKRPTPPTHHTKPPPLPSPRYSGIPRRADIYPSFHVTGQGRPPTPICRGRREPGGLFTGGVWRTIQDGLRARRGQSWR